MEQERMHDEKGSLARLRSWLMGPRDDDRARPDDDDDGADFEPGAVFTHRGASGPTELALIVDTARDETGVLHVHYQLFYRYRFRTEEAGERYMSVGDFRRRFTNRVDLEAAAPPGGHASG